MTSSIMLKLYSHVQFFSSCAKMSQNLSETSSVFQDSTLNILLYPLNTKTKLTSSKNNPSKFTSEVLLSLLQSTKLSNMALARLALRNLQQRVSCSSPLVRYNLGKRSASSLGGVQRQRWANEFLKRFMATAAKDDKSEGKEVSVPVTEKKSKLFPRRKGRRGSLWKWRHQNDVPALYEFFPSGLGNALMQATENINRLFENLAPSQLMGRVKEQDECYKLRYEVPGLGKDDVKITIDDGVLTIKGEHKEEEEEGSDDEYWSSRSYGYYNTSLVLPDGAKVDDIKAELKDGVLNITIPRTEKPKRDVKEVEVH